jgi:hypothetical protein
MLLLRWRAARRFVARNFGVELRTARMFALPSRTGKRHSARERLLV